MSTSPRLLDLFCGAGGAARGYQLAGFRVTGVDHRSQPRYAGDHFCQADIMKVGLPALLRELGPFDAVHASPPCQFASRATAWRGRRTDHVNLIPPTRAQLLPTGLPYVIENVQEARSHLINPLLLCGSMFGISVERHRYFETNWTIFQPATCAHAGLLAFDHGGTATESDGLHRLHVPVRALHRPGAGRLRGLHARLREGGWVTSVMLRRLQFEVPGIPQPQGSTKSFARGGKVVTTSDNPRLRPWRDAVCWHARQAIAGQSKLIGPVTVSAIFYLPRPTGHYGTGRNAGSLRNSAPFFPAVKPDLDKLMRGILDAISEAGLWRDDAQVVGFGEVLKRYGDKPGACISIEEHGEL